MLIPAKLSRPLRLENTLLRDRLIARLSNSNLYRLVLVTSPAGYGKTTLIAQWAAEKSGLGWYSLDDSDNYPERFASYFMAAVQQATDGHCVRSEALAQKRQYASLNGLFAQLFIELSEWQRPLSIVIDDYHLLTNDAIHQAMRFFIRHQPENLTLVILSRNLPSLGIANLRVRDQLLEINSQSLAFTHQETGAFFAARLQQPIAEVDSQRLCDEVAGWATALQLIALSARQSNTPAHQSAQRLAGINASHLSDYLVDEVLDCVDEGTRNFLLRSSVLRSMNDALIARLTGEENGQRRLEETERQGLFLQRMDESGEWFNFHPLFASFLRQRCQWELGSELHTIHRAAAEGWMALGYAGEAIHHALAAEDTALLRDILLRHAWTLFNHSELTLLEKGLKALPWRQLVDHPRLILLQAWLAQSQHRYDEVDLLLARAEQEMALEKVTVDALLSAEFNALRAQVAINAGRPDEADRLATLALDTLPLSCDFSRIVATSVRGEVLHCRGELAQALAMMQQTAQMARQQGVCHYALWALLQQSEILIAQGYLQTAWDTQEQAFRLIAEEGLEQLPMHEFLLRIRAQLLLSWANLDEAEKSARAGLKVLENFHPQQQLQCLSVLAKCALARGDLDNARRYLTRCENLLSNGHYHSDWVTNADEARVIYWQMNEDRSAAANWLRLTQKPADADNHFLQGQWRNIARAQIMLGQLDEAEVVLDELNDNARRLQLTSDLNRNLLLANALYWQAGRKGEAQQALIEALTLANRTGFISHFVVEGEAMAQQLRQLIQLHTLPEMEQRRAQRILRDINQHHRHKFAHFDETFVTRLLTHPQVPELIRTSPLTLREWQVLGLIYSGYSNDQIAGELDVAATTIKTHIRNLYQKLGVVHRQEAVQQAQQLLHLMGMGVN
ncbi:transcriptional regulator MalT [bacteria symbiont BFo1 of Frankliniella occidentalis]|uniref:HTH-type transcriptional regulator MalT n=1 Tax=Erwinia aphidicola TaxID=68334 RepID=UPI000664607E|nr:HTH-type transcriptional regulator MalT [Erwinia aphidicola]KMV68394.1 transcriptional regulator MalT [bacteria symbiont BFo1 of Frankliniella occidentalis]PIJ59814.1 transcriptional regulator MalT [Erwinia sp. OLMDLW33]VTT28546.1 transcriptional regulator MalT [Klebsiella pneumoniae]KYP83161.1 transcriptional regulator MalT [bacteria symbiont BFo1 of Frankliniella occidentalis]KYP88036.1 transcriptional regulator MalT [bacteria symbiont BFo1 of Frankliniella occidentalis]